MELADFVENLIMGEFGHIPSGHIRMHPKAFPGLDHNIGDVKQLGMVKGVRFYGDPGIPEGQVRFIDAEGKITVLFPQEKKVEPKAPKKKPVKKKTGRKNKARSVQAGASKKDSV